MSQKFPVVVLHRHKTEAVRRFHPWIFSGAIHKKDNCLQDGDVVEVRDDKGHFLALGHYSPGSIAVRVFSFKPVDDLPALWHAKLQQAYAVRSIAKLTDVAHTNCYRLVFAEADGMPGLIADWYNGTVVLQCHSVGMYRQRQHFAEALKSIYGNRLKAVYDKSSAALHLQASDLAPEPATVDDGYLWGSPDTDIVTEHNHHFKVNWHEGQKTGFFIDQRDNRQLLASYSKGKTVLNTFCYTGGFSVYALKAGAALVHSVDSSAKAIALTNENVQLNGNYSGIHQSYTADVFDFMKQTNQAYDVMVLDPPAFAKGISARHNALKAYRRLNGESFRHIKSGGILFTFSCSQVITRDLFESAVTAAAIDSGRTIRILHHLSQPACHPVSIFHPEGLYLKGLVLHVV